MSDNEHYQTQRPSGQWLRVRTRMNVQSNRTPHPQRHSWSKVVMISHETVTLGNSNGRKGITEDWSERRMREVDVAMFSRRLKMGEQRV